MKHSQVLDLLASIPDIRDRLIVRTIYATVFLYLEALRYPAGGYRLRRAHYPG